MQNKLKMLWKAFLTGALVILATSVGYATDTYAPSLIQPSNGNKCVEMKQKFIWQEEAEAEYYVLQISDNIEFTGALINEDEQLQTYTKEITFKEEQRNTKFYWRVIVQFNENVKDEKGNNKRDTSLIWSFTTVQPIAKPTFPLTTTAGHIETNMTFTWNKPEGTTDYRIQVASAKDFAEKSIVLDEVVNSPYSATDKIGKYQWKAPKNSTTYFWRIRSEVAEDACGSEWSDINTFITAAKAPIATEPMNNAIGQSQNITFKWSYSGSNQGFVLRYSTDETFKEGEETKTINNIGQTKHTVQGLEKNTTYYWQVAAMVGGHKSDWSEVFQFTTEYNKTRCLAPINNEKCISLTPELLWEAQDAARGYSVEIRSSEITDNEDNVVFRQDNINDTKVVAMSNTMQGLTKYYWRVRLSDKKNQGPWSEFASFVTTYAAPKVVSPTQNQVGVEKTTKFEWIGGNNPQDLEYMIEIYTEKDSLGQTIHKVLHRDTVAAKEVNTYEYEMPAFSADYAWRVAAINKVNCNGMWTEMTKFTTMLGDATLLLPEDKSRKLENEIVFSWEPVDFATNYEIQVAYANEENSFDNKFLAKTLLGIKGTEVKLKDLQYETNYIWRVRAYNPKSTGKWSTVFSFRTKIAPAEKPILVAPANEATKVEIKPTFSWKAAKYATNYELVVATDPSFESVIIKKNLEKLTRMDTTVTKVMKYDTTWVDDTQQEIEKIDSTETDVTTIKEVLVDTLTFESIELQNFQTHYWKVAAINVEKDYNWSDTWKFRTTAIKFDKAPNLIAPADKSTNVDMDVKFEWQRLLAAERYHIQVSRTADFEKIEMEDQNVTFNIRSVHMNDFGTEYFWRVRAINEVGEGPWSEPFTFVTSGTSSVEGDVVKFNVYPNPTFDVLRVSYNSAVAQDAVLYIVDASGKVVLTKSQALSANANSIELSVRHLVQGNYFLTIKAANGEENTIRFTVIK